MGEHGLGRAERDPGRRELVKIRKRHLDNFGAQTPAPDAIRHSGCQRRLGIALDVCLVVPNTDAFHAII